MKRSLLCALATVGLFAVGAGCASTPVARAAVLPAEKMSLPPAAGSVQPDRSAPDGRALKIWSNATASGRITTPATVRIDVRVRGEQCQGAPVIALRVDGTPVGTAAVSSTTYRTYAFSKALAAGTHRVEVALTNDHAMGWCDRNVWLDWVQFDQIAPTPAPVTPAPARQVSTPSPSPSPTRSPSPSPSVSTSVSASATNPFTGAALYVDPDSQAAAAAALIGPSDPAAAALLNKIAGQPQADWFGDWNATAQVAYTVRSRISTIEASDDLPVLVTYAIPGRDCGGYSAGGLATAGAYHDWITQFAAGIGSSQAVVIVEPDALAQLDCLPAAAQADRMAELKDAIAVLTALPRTAVYVDAGHSGWQSVATMTSRLNALGTAKIRGFSLNVSGFGDTTSQLAYGEQIAAATGTHYVVDTSRNGLGAGTSTCNPAGRALGDRPTALTSAENADAYLWIKHPGESDGDCGSGDPAAGVWSATLAEDLASRAAW